MWKLILTFFLISSSSVSAHSPHDVIHALGISPSYDQDKTIFITIAHILEKSIDGGHSWKILIKGLDNIYPFSSIALSPSYSSDETLFISSRGNGIYKSEDGGTSWKKLNKGLNSPFVSFVSIASNYHSHKTAFAATSKGGLYKIDKNSDRWTQVLEDAIRITAIICFPMNTQDHVIAGDQNGVLYLSTNRGDTWKKYSTIAGCGAIRSIAIPSNFSSNDMFFVGTEECGVYKTVDGGNSFTEANSGIFGKYITSILISPDYKTDSTIYATTWNKALFHSTDGGKSWELFDKDLTTDPQAEAKPFRWPHFKGIAIGKDSEKNDKTFFLGGFDGLFMSVDGGYTWVQMETLPLKLIMGLDVSPESRIYHIALTTYGGGAFITKDKGKNWIVANQGLNTTRLSDIVFSPFYQEDSTIFSAELDHMLKSTDQGTHWNRIRKHLDIWKLWRFRLNRYLQKRGVSPSFRLRLLGNLDLVLGWPTRIVISPAFHSDSTIYFGTRSRGIYKSTDGGLTCSVIWDAMGDYITSLAISPDFSFDKTLFVSLAGKGIYKTIDGGKTWHEANHGINKIRQQAITISPHYKMDKTVFAGAAKGLFKTVDGGKNWKKLEDALFHGYENVLSIALSPNYKMDNTVIVSIQGRGLFKTEDGGNSFTEIGRNLIDTNYQLKLIEFSPAYQIDNTIYGASTEEVFKSTDDGYTWEAIPRPVRYEEMREVVQYEGNWETLKGNHFSASSITRSHTINSKALLRFFGTGVMWIGEMSSEHGTAKVYIDRNFKGYVSQYSDVQKNISSIYSITDMPQGPHEITIEVATPERGHLCGYISLDAFDVFP